MDNLYVNAGIPGIPGGVTFASGQAAVQSNWSSVAYLLMGAVAAIVVVRLLK